jgi:hypothetical protein
VALIRAATAVTTLTKVSEIVFSDAGYLHLNRRIAPVSARNSAALRDLRIFVDHSVEPVTPNDLGLGYVGLGECS